LDTMAAAGFSEVMLVIFIVILDTLKSITI